MRRSRLKADPSGRVPAYYHCVSRVVNRAFVLGPQEKEMFVRLMRRWESFCGVRVVTFCVLDNHFHLLLEVPPRPETLPSDEELLARLKALYRGTGGLNNFREQYASIEASGSPEALAQWREGILRRMWDVSAYMKALKQQFTQWFNGRHGRRGTLWEERFKSVLVEGAGPALATMAAYIDLNPIRAGVVSDPKAYRWCGYAQAVAGQRAAREGLATIVTAADRPAENWRQTQAEYRWRLFGEGEERGVSDPERGYVARRGFSREAVAQVLAENGRLSLFEALRCRVRYFSDGAALGRKAFLEGVFVAERHRFGPRRRDGARPLRRMDAGGLCTLRDLQVRVIG